MKIEFTKMKRKSYVLALSLKTILFVTEDYLKKHVGIWRLVANK